MEQHSSPEADAGSARASPASSRRTAGRSSSPPEAATRSTRWRTRSAAVRSSWTCPTARRSSRGRGRDGRRRAARGQRRRQRSGRRDLGDRSRRLVARAGDQRPRRPPLLPSGDPGDARARQRTDRDHRERRRVPPRLEQHRLLHEQGGGLPLRRDAGERAARADPGLLLQPGPREDGDDGPLGRRPAVDAAGACAAARARPRVGPGGRARRPVHPRRARRHRGSDRPRGRDRRRRT